MMLIMCPPRNTYNAAHRKKVVFLWRKHKRNRKRKRKRKMRKKWIKKVLLYNFPLEFALFLTFSTGPELRRPFQRHANGIFIFWNVKNRRRFLITNLRQFQSAANILCADLWIFKGGIPNEIYICEYFKKRLPVKCILFATISSSSVYNIHSSYCWANFVWGKIYFRFGSLQAKCYIFINCNGLKFFKNTISRKQLNLNMRSFWHIQIQMIYMKHNKLSPPNIPDRIFSWGLTSNIQTVLHPHIFYPVAFPCSLQHPTSYIQHLSVLHSWHFQLPPNIGYTISHELSRHLFQIYIDLRIFFSSIIDTI